MKKNRQEKCCYSDWLAPWFAILSAIVVLIMPWSLAVDEAKAAVGGTTIGGCIYTGHGTVNYTLNAAGEPVANWATDFAPSPNTPPISNAQVMLQKQAGGAVIGYGTTGLDGAGNPVAGGNCWEAAVPSTDGITPDATDLVVMFAAPGHDVTSREFTWNAALREFTHPKQGGGVVGVDAEIIGAQDAYLPPLLNVNPVTGAGIQKTANLMHYVFYDNFTNGGDNGPVIDPGLNGVTVTVTDTAGNVVQTQKTGALAFSQGGFVTSDGLAFIGADAYGAVYFTGLPGGQSYKVTSDPTTVTQADNPHMTLKVNHTGEVCSLDRATGPYGYGNTNCNWYQTVTEAGGPAWDVYLWPGDPGTELGAYMTWHGFIEKLGNNAGAVNLPGTISGILLDADGNDPAEPFPQTGGGRVPPTNARFEDGTPWNVNLNSAGWGGCITQPGAICPPLGMDYIPNGRISDAIVALYSTGGGVPKLVATTEATQPTYYNSPNGGQWSFTNVPPGAYEVFTFDRDLINVPTVGTAVNIIPGTNLPVTIMNPRFAARGAGFVMNNGAPVAATVKVQFVGGSTQLQADTNPATGWFEVFNLPETGGLGKFYVDLKNGDAIRGKIITEKFQRVGPLGLPIYTDVTHNAMSRSAQWWTLNYFIDLQVETIPAGVGNLMGVVFSDSLATGSWAIDGIWLDGAETTNPGETVELYATVIDPTTGLAVCPDLATSPLPLATAVTGNTNEADAKIMGWVPVGTFPPNEIGGVFGDPVVCNTGDPLNNCSQTTGTPAPAYGFYEFRDVTPGDYCVRAVPQPGFRHSPESVDGLTLVSVRDGLNSRINLGVTATPTAALGGPAGNGLGACNAVDPLLPLVLSCDNNRAVTCTTDADCANLPSPTGGVPLAGLLEGGVFSGNGNLDPNPTSTMFDEAMNIVGAPVGVYDQYNYLLGVMYQTDAWCNTANNAIHTPGTYPADPFACSSATDIIQPPEMARYFAPGMFRYAGNDPKFTKDPAIAQPGAGGITFAGNDKIRGFDPRFETMELGAGFGQGLFLLEFAWTPLTPANGSVTADICAIGLAGITFNSAPWGGNVTITVSDGYAPVAGARVSGSAGGRNGEPCITDGFGQCTMSFEKFDGAGNSVVFTVNNIVPADPWYVYNPTAGGFLAGACQTSVTLYDPNFTVPPPLVYACSDGLDNDGDGLIDFPADPGCVTATDTDESNTPAPVYQCSDGIDNDGDGFIDMADPGCTSPQDNDETNLPPDPVFACSDGLDNDGDGLIDFPADPGCLSLSDNDETGPVTACNDGIDNDGDGLIDMADPGCTSPQDTDEFNAPLPACSDRLDNDGDGLIDFPADPGCLSATDNDETDPVPVYACSDGLDNDGDGLIDFPADPGCTSATDNDEFNAPLPKCSDGIDNDGDGKIDFPADPGCTDIYDNDETNPVYACSDGIDNDGDGLTDFPADPGCTSATDNDEFNAPLAQCADGIDNDGDGKIDFPADPGCTDAADNDETDPVYACSDGIDNDGDTLIDFPNDPGCTSATDNNESNAPLPACSDRIDNDGDGLIDFPADPGCTSATDTNETDPLPICSDGLDNDGDGLTDFPADPGCTSATDNDEFNAPLAQCADGIDNDGDGKIDFPADPGCTSTADNDETDLATSVHATSLTGTALYLEGKLAARVTVAIKNNLGNAVQGASVSMTYTRSKEGIPTSRNFSCTTGATGTCTATTPYMEKTTSVAIKLNTVSGTLPYRPQDDTVAPITVP